MSDDFFGDDIQEQTFENKMTEDPFADAGEEIGEEDPFANAGPSAPVVDEFRFSREWNMQFREKCEARDKAAMDEKQKILKKAREDLKTWREGKEKKLAVKAETNRKNEAALVEGNNEDMNSVNSWERVNKLVDVNAIVEHDLSRMKQVMIRMKNDSSKM